MAPIVSIEHVEFAYRPRETPVLAHIDLSIEPGTTLGLIGPNGGGKTTLIKLLLGLFEPTKGQIRICGTDPARAVQAGDVVGYLPQRPEVPANFPISVLQLVRLGLAGKTGMLRGYSRDDLAFVDSLIARIGIADLVDVPVGELSGGQLQRALIARALAPRPKLLLLDEPTVGIDPAGQTKLLEFIASLKNDLGLTVVFVSHDLRAVGSIADRIACLDHSLHYHDVPQHLPADLVFKLFACDMEAIGIKGQHVLCPHDHEHNSQRSQSEIQNPKSETR